jgi:hypothetical protein
MSMSSLPSRTAIRCFVCFSRKLFDLQTAAMVDWRLKRRQASTSTLLDVSALIHPIISRTAPGQGGIRTPKCHYQISAIFRSNLSCCRHSILLAVGCSDRQRTGQNLNGQGAAKLAVLRQTAINAIEKEGSKGSLRGKFRRASRNKNYLCRLLGLF